MFFIVDTEVFFLSHLFDTFPKLAYESMSAFTDVLRANNQYTVSFSTMELPCGFGRRHHIRRRSVLENPKNTFRWYFINVWFDDCALLQQMLEITIFGKFRNFHIYARWWIHIFYMYLQHTCTSLLCLMKFRSFQIETCTTNNLIYKDNSWRIFSITTSKLFIEEMFYDKLRTESADS